MSRYLIINADDFGISPGTNDAIRQLFDGEKITSAGILAPAPFAPEAAKLAAKGGYSIGVHWTLTSEWADFPWEPCCKDAASLLEAGFLAADKGKAKQAKSADVTKELEGQYQALLAMGCRPDHADSHAGTLYGTNGRLFFLNACRLCKKYGLPFRFAKQDSFLPRQLEKDPGTLLRTAAKTLARVGQLYGVGLLDDFYSDPRPVERIGSPAELKAYYEAQLSTLQGEICEVFMHPCLPEEELLQRSKQWQKRVWEYEYLKSGDLLTAAKEAGFTVVSWKEAPFS